jgi:hypothetical protein
MQVSGEAQCWWDVAQCWWNVAQRWRDVAQCTWYVAIPKVQECVCIQIWFNQFGFSWDNPLNLVFLIYPQQEMHKTLGDFPSPPSPPPPSPSSCTHMYIVQHINSIFIFRMCGNTIHQPFTRPHKYNVPPFQLCVLHTWSFKSLMSFVVKVLNDIICRSCRQTNIYSSIKIALQESSTVHF